MTATLLALLFASAQLQAAQGFFPRGATCAAQSCRAGTVARGATAAAFSSVMPSSVGDEELALAELLVSLGQESIFESWSPGDNDAAAKAAFFEQVRALNDAYPGGLEAYVSKARELLEASAKGENPFEGFTPLVPEGEALEYGTEQFEALEAEGLSAAAEGIAFVLVAGGLGERLGFSGIKVALPLEMTTGRTFLAYYAEYILALQSRCREISGDESLTLPLAIMTSDDTDAPTRALIEEAGNLGMAEGQLRIIKQDKVPALADRSASLAMKGPYEIETKPHGHGDVHHLLYREALLDEWQAAGVRWLFFFQDTNALVTNSLLPALGVSRRRDLDMNSICVPRSAGEAAGAITRLVNEGSGESLTINVEYNQLDPLLRATVSPEGDVNDPATGLSPFPGNANNLLFRLDAYADTCRGEAQGVVPEFVNPKYKDAERNEFKKPTRLECMMQDFPRLMKEELPQGTSRVGFTSLPKWLSFSPAKNDLVAGAANGQGGVPPGTVASSEADFYLAAEAKMAAEGADFTGDRPSVAVEGLDMPIGPQIVLSPHAALTAPELREAFKGLSATRDSTVVVEGEGKVAFDGVSVDGELRVRTAEGVSLRLQGTRIATAKQAVLPLSDEEKDAAPATLRIRGYRVTGADDAVVLDIREPGDYLVGEDPSDVTRL